MPSGSAEIVALTHSAVNHLREAAIQIARARQQQAMWSQVLSSVTAARSPASSGVVDVTDRDATWVEDLVGEMGDEVVAETTSERGSHGDLDQAFFGDEHTSD